MNLFNVLEGGRLAENTSDAVSSPHCRFIRSLRRWLRTFLAGYDLVLSGILRGRCYRDVCFEITVDCAESYR